MATDLTQEFCALRDTYIEKQFGRLNDMQRQAVFTTDGPLLIPAGAGLNAYREFAEEIVPEPEKPEEEPHEPRIITNAVEV